jgi:hypothetical protein
MLGNLPGSSVRISAYSSFVSRSMSADRASKFNFQKSSLKAKVESENLAFALYDRYALSGETSRAWDSEKERRLSSNFSQVHNPVLALPCAN